MSGSVHTVVPTVPNVIMIGAAAALVAGAALVDSDLPPPPPKKKQRQKQQSNNTPASAESPPVDSAPGNASLKDASSPTLPDLLLVQPRLPLDIMSSAPTGEPPIRGGEFLTQKAALRKTQIDHVETLRLSSSDVSSISTNVYRYIGLSGEPLVSVEIPTLILRLKRVLVARNDTFILNGSVVAIPQRQSLAETLAEVETLARAAVDSTFCIAPSSTGLDWRAYSRSPFTLSFTGSFADVVGAGPFTAVASQGRYVVPLQSADINLARVVTVSINEMGGGDAGLIATILIDGESDVVAFDGRGDARAIDIPLPSTSITLRFVVRRPDGSDASQSELVSWSATLRLGFMRGTPVFTNLSAQDEVNINNNYTTGNDLGFGLDNGGSSGTSSGTSSGASSSHISSQRGTGIPSERAY